MFDLDTATSGDLLAHGLMSFTFQIEGVSLNKEDELQSLLYDVARTVRSMVPSSGVRVTVSDSIGGVQFF